MVGEFSETFFSLYLGVKTPEICTPEELMEVFNEG
jgi:hypothetical protein